MELNSQEKYFLKLCLHGDYDDELMTRRPIISPKFHYEMGRVIKVDTPTDPGNPWTVDRVVRMMRNC